jgi:hypothetical protein
MHWSQYYDEVYAEQIHVLVRYPINEFIAALQSLI